MTALKEAGIGAEFKAGVLVAGGTIISATSGVTGQLLLEGPVTDEYYQIRDVVYSLYSMC
jgi:hypothetical protein